jgi:hypothetical protein
MCEIALKKAVGVGIGLQRGRIEYKLCDATVTNCQSGD